MCKACGKLGGSGGMFPWEIVILELGSQVGELQHYYVSPGSYLRRLCLLLIRGDR